MKKLFFLTSLGLFALSLSTFATHTSVLYFCNEGHKDGLDVLAVIIKESGKISLSTKNDLKDMGSPDDCKKVAAKLNRTED